VFPSNEDIRVSTDKPMTGRAEISQKENNNISEQKWKILAKYWKKK